MTGDSDLCLWRARGWGYGHKWTYWSPASPVFPVRHFRELGPESLKVPGMGLRGCGVGWSPLFFGFTCGCGAAVGPFVRDCETERTYRWYGLQRRCDRLVPQAVVLVVLCELVLPRGIPQ
ncbi:hypothetical protein Taro_052425, partial [Colocasia esculenta]|nr:hypothetical protein [Colocasia esculenta]